MKGRRRILKATERREQRSSEYEVRKIPGYTDVHMPIHMVLLD